MALRINFAGGFGVSAIAIAISTSAVPTAAFAQETPADAADESEIIITGFRASLESAVNTKKSADQIVESVSAEDIGKLPDASIAESIARLPGLTSQRVAGRSNESTRIIRSGVESPVAVSISHAVTSHSFPSCSIP